MFVFVKTKGNKNIRNSIFGDRSLVFLIFNFVHFTVHTGTGYKNKLGRSQMRTFWLDPTLQ